MNLLTKIRNVYNGLTPDSDEGKAVLEMKDSVEKIQQLFADAQVATVSDYWRNRFEQDYQLKHLGKTQTLEEYVADRVKRMEESIAENKKRSVEDWYYYEVRNFLNEHIEASDGIDVEEFSDTKTQASIREAEQAQKTPQIAV